MSDRVLTNNFREACWINYQSGSDKSGDSYREGYTPTKVEAAGLFLLRQPSSYKKKSSLFPW